MYRLKSALCGLLIKHSNELITKYFESCSLFSPEGKGTTCLHYFYLDILIFPGVKKFVFLLLFLKLRYSTEVGFMALHGILGVRSTGWFL